MAALQPNKPIDINQIKYAGGTGTSRPYVRPAGQSVYEGLIKLENLPDMIQRPVACGSCNNAPSKYIQVPMRWVLEAFTTPETATLKRSALSARLLADTTVTHTAPKQGNITPETVQAAAAQALTKQWIPYNPLSDTGNQSTHPQFPAYLADVKTFLGINEPEPEPVVETPAVQVETVQIEIPTTVNEIKRFLTATPEMVEAVEVAEQSREGGPRATVIKKIESVRRQQSDG